MLLHGLEQCGLRLRRGAVDFIRQTIWANSGPRELELAAAGLRVFGDDVRADDVGGHQVRRELDAGEVQTEGLGQRADEQRLAQPRHALQQRMPAGEQAYEHRFDHVIVADDHLLISAFRAANWVRNSATCCST